jgi:hypothetical protein
MKKLDENVNKNVFRLSLSSDSTRQNIMSYYVIRKAVYFPMKRRRAKSIGEHADLKSCSYPTRESGGEKAEENAGAI